MKRKASHSLQKQLVMLALFLSLVMTISGCQSDRVGPLETSTTKSMKGYELYSWQMQGDWYFALVIGTNRIKTYDEVSSPEVCVQGVEALEHELNQLPSGEQVFWSIQRVPNMTLPPNEVVDEIRTYCRQRGIQLVIEQTPLSSDAMEATTTPPTTEIQGIELVGYLGGDQAQTVSVQGDYAYVGFGIQLAVVDVSDPGRPQRVGYVVLPNRVLDIAVADAYAYIATGFDGLQVIDVSDPTQPTVIDTCYVSSHVNGVVTDDACAYASNGTLRVMDLSDPAAPVEVGAYHPSDLSLVGKVLAVVGDYAYTVYDGSSSKSGGLRTVDISDPTTPTEVGTFVTGGPVRDVAVSGDYAYLLVGQGIPHLAIVDLSDPEHPAEISLDPIAPWLGQSLAVVDRYVYLAYPGSPDSVGYLQVLDVADLVHPAEIGRYEGLTSTVADIALQGEQAYIAAGDGLHIVNVADPAAPAVAGLYRPDATLGAGRDVVVVGNPSSGSGQVYAYVAAGEGGLLVVDVSDPVNPKVVSRHDTAGQTWDVVLVGGYAYLADEYNGLRVIYVADPFNPVEVGFYDIPGLHEFFHGVAVAGDYAYIADGGLLNTGLRIVDISDPASPAEASFFPIEIQTADGFLPARAESVVAANGYVYVAAGTAGLRVVDISDPAAPIETGFYDTPGRADNLAVVGHYAYVADGDLRIVDVSNPIAPAEVGFYDVPGMLSTPHVAIQGPYAYITGQGIRVLDISEPGAPVEVCAHPFASGNVAVAGDMVYVIGNGLFILRTLGGVHRNSDARQCSAEPMVITVTP